MTPAARPRFDSEDFYSDLPQVHGRDPVTNQRIIVGGKPPYHSWFTGGIRGSLYEQDLFNAYFAYRTLYLPPGYNIWAKVRSAAAHTEEAYRQKRPQARNLPPS